MSLQGIDKGAIETALALLRRYALAIAEGRIEASAIGGMSDEELLAFDEQKFNELDQKQKEAEDLLKGE